MDGTFELLNPSIFIGDWEIREPITALTDFVAAAVCFFAYHRLGVEKRQHRVERLMRSYFLFMGLGYTMAGFLGHGLQAYVGWEWKIPGWLITGYAITLYALSSFELVLPRLGNRYHRMLSTLVVGLLVSMVILLALPDTRDFFVVRMFNTIVIIGLILPVHFYLWNKDANPGSLWVLGSMAVGILTALVFSFQVTFDRWFNYHDICHMLMALHSYLLYQATLRFIPQKEGMLEVESSDQM